MEAIKHFVEKNKVLETFEKNQKKQELKDSLHELIDLMVDNNFEIQVKGRKYQTSIDMSSIGFFTKETHKEELSKEDREKLELITKDITNLHKEI